MSFLIEPFKLAIKSILSNKLRSMLTTMGVIIGVSAVITLVSMGEGAKSYILNQVKGWGLGANAIEIHPGREEVAIPELTLTYEDTLALRDRIKEIKYMMPEIVGKGLMKYGKKEYTPAFTMGTSFDYPQAVTQNVADGRFFTKAEEDSGKHVTVIGKTVARKLFGEYSPVGETVKINGSGFKIIGILEEKGSMLTYDMDDMTLIPLSVTSGVIGTDKIWEILVSLNSEQDVPQAISGIKKLLIYRHKKEDFHIHTQQGLVDIVNNILNALTGIVSAIAAISLLVGGIGIMNIMLVTVTERTREIGIRKAIGAKKRDIFMQFVIESIMITMTGAFVGILLGTLAAWGIMSALKMEAVIAFGAIYLSCFVALIVGLFFGVYPAMRAASLNPVEALRYEI